LLLNIYQERLVDQQLDKEITAEEIASFYEANSAMFKMEEPMIKGLLLKVSKKAPKLDAVRRWCKSTEPAELEKLEKYTLTNAQLYEYFYDSWMPISALAAKIALSEEDLKQKVTKKDMIEFSDSASLYIMNISDYLPVGELKPLDLAESEIKELLVNSRKADFLQQVKKDIYNEAISGGKVKYFMNKPE
ncbi:MAG: peptidyl-prolyl cis-trans isomerase, partial [Bacteroidaceae bacterium]|nr:peptidyl-prolyl cis-trans isomerase [Bacteroidaceae bacterium]